MDFIPFKRAVRDQLRFITGKSAVVYTKVDKDLLWETYLASFPEGSNPIFRERTEHDCQCCKQFIRNCGSMVAVVGYELRSIWDIQVGGEYQVVADAMSKLVKSYEIDNIFLHWEKNLGTDYNFDGHTEPPLKFEHFHYKLADRFVNRDTADSVKGDARTNMEVLRRSLQEITTESAEVVLDLIGQDSLYRGEEHALTVGQFLKLKRLYFKIAAPQLDAFCWRWAATLGHGARFRNTVIGTLMSDLSAEVPLEEAVKAFESKVAPENYKRPTALITQGMIKKAQKKVAELGIGDSLPRRYAMVDDLTVNNVLFVDRTTKQKMGVFDEMLGETRTDPGKFDKVEEVAIDHFVEKVLPTCTKLEMMFENRHKNHLMSVIAPVNRDAPNILKWDNNFSWSYRGEVTDSIKERVKRAGGNVEGVLRCSLSWYNRDDLDIHVVEPRGQHIYFGDHRPSNSTGNLDVDMNAGGRNLGVDMNAGGRFSREPVENITWTDECKMQEGTYRLYVHNYNKRETMDVGFVVEVEYGGKIHTFPYPKDVKNRGTVEVALFNFTRKDGLKFKKCIESTETPVNEWGVNTCSFIPVNMLIQSPNHWDGQAKGNKHWFFILQGCRNEGKARGLYNEFLDPRLTEHRKVFEVLGSKMKVEESDAQLSGLGFSSTKRDSVLCRVYGTFDRVIKITF